MDSDSTRSSDGSARDTDTIRLLEDLALSAWPAQQHLFYDGWLLRFASGYTRRSNSVNMLAPSTQDVHAKIARCEQVYAAKGFQPVFRITPLASPPDLDYILEQRGYTVHTPSLLLHADLSNLPPQLAPELPPDLHMHTLSPDAWFDCFCRVSGLSPLDAPQRTHRSLLDNIASPCLYLVLIQDDNPVACALGVLDRGYVGLFDLVTAQQQRNQGYATHVLAGLLHQAQRSGATHSYLQVARDNAAAHRLYARLGYQEAYLYWYRFAPEGMVPT